MVNYGEALKRPFTDIKALVIGLVLVVIPVILGTVLIGGQLFSNLAELSTLKGMQDPQQILNVLSSTFLTPKFLGVASLVVLIGLVLNWIIGGYYFRCIESMLGKTKKKFAMPKWDKWGDLLVKGLLIFILWIIYFIALIILVLLSAITIVGPLILMLLFAYIMPSVLISFVEEGRFGGGFKLGRIFKKAFTGKYFLAWLFSAVTIVVLSMVFGMFIPLVGGSIAGFLAMIISLTALTEAYSEVKK